MFEDTDDYLNHQRVLKFVDQLETYEDQLETYEDQLETYEDVEIDLRLWVVDEKHQSWCNYGHVHQYMSN